MRNNTKKLSKISIQKENREGGFSPPFFLKMTYDPFICVIVNFGFDRHYKPHRKIKTRNIYDSVEKSPFNKSIKSDMRALNSIKRFFFEVVRKSLFVTL